MWDFDGRTWTAPRVLYGTPEFTAHGPPVAYEVTLEPHSKRWLFALDLPGQGAAARVRERRLPAATRSSR